MANTLTNLVGELQEAMDVVSREQTGLIMAVSKDNSAERAELNQTIRIPVTQSQEVEDNTPGVNSPDTGDQTVGNQTMTINKSKHVPIRWNGEQTRGQKNNGMFSSILADQTAQAMRALINLIEADIASQYIYASRAYGTAGATPFASNLSDANNAKKILDDNGAPLSDRHLVINSTAGVKMRNLVTLNQANTAGSDSLLRQGVLLPLSGMDIRESAQIKTVTKGGGTSYTSTTAGFAVGVTSIPLITGSGTVLAGDVVTFTGDTNKYVVKTGIAAPGTIVLAAPGLREPLAASAVAMTIGGDFEGNMFFHRSAIQLATRMPALPDGGDLAIDVTQITDPVTGLTFEFALYPQFMQNVIHVRLAWGAKLIKPEHAGILLG